jgi:AcrR family transcriptional regulator
MGHKEDLLAGAKKCLREKGYANTTARDIVAASGTNLASIGYHFGSKDALMTQAIVEMLSEWGEQFGGESAGSIADYGKRFETHWRDLAAAVASDRQLSLASFENASTSMRIPELSAIIAEGQEEARVGMGDDFAASDADASTKRAVGSLMLAVTTGVIAQWLVDPKRSPSPDDIVKAFQAIGEAFAEK